MAAINKTALGACLLAAILLAGGYWLANSWLGILAVLVMAAGWLAARKINLRWMPSMLLITFIGASAAGILTGVQPYLMIAGSAFALTGWELSDQGSRKVQVSTPLRNLYLRERLTLAVVSIGLGVILAEAGLFLKIAIPFGFLFFIALAVLVCLFFFFRSVNH